MSNNIPLHHRKQEKEKKKTAEMDVKKIFYPL